MIQALIVIIVIISIGIKALIKYYEEKNRFKSIKLVHYCGHSIYINQLPKSNVKKTVIQIILFIIE